METENEEMLRECRAIRLFDSGGGPRAAVLIKAASPGSYIPRR
jgi:hypothetical protein